MTTTITFEQAMQTALRDGKYSYLTGRFDTIGERITSLVEAVIRFISNLFNLGFAGFGDGVNTDVVSGIFVVVAIAVLGISAAFIARMVLQYKQSALTSSSEIFEDYRNNRLSFDEIMVMAKNHESERNLKEAVRCRYLALIMLFNAKDIVRVTDSMTGAQFEREARKNMPSSQKGVRELITMYYTLFFGHKSVSDEAYKNHIETYEPVMKEALAFDKD